MWAATEEGEGTIMNEGYAHPELLAETDWLAEHVHDPHIRVIDCGAIDAYRRAHIPGAVGLPVHNFIKDANDPTYVMPPDQFADLMSSLGVADDTLVVTYDDGNSLYAARLWWVLDYYGHPNTKVLNGGWHKWLTEGRPVTFHPPQVERTQFTPKVNEQCICRIDYLKSKIGSEQTAILDVRTDGEWLGTDNRGNKRAGHVPGAVHLEWTNFMTRDDRRTFKPVAEIRTMLAEQGITPEKEVLTY